MDTFTAKIYRFIRDKDLLTADDRVVAGISGGSDSICLLMVLSELKPLLGRTLPEGSTVARLDGDEFAALVETGAGGEGLARLAQGVIAALSAPVAWHGHEIKIGATVGIAAAGPEAGTADAVLHAADLAMVQGKRDGRGTYRVFETAMDEALKARARMEAELRVAIECG